MTAGRIPAWVCPGIAGRRTRQTSLLCIGFALSGQTFDQLQGSSASSVPGIQFGLQLRWDVDRSVDDFDLHERPLRQWRVGTTTPFLTKPAMMTVMAWPSQITTGDCNRLASPLSSRLRCVPPSGNIHTMKATVYFETTIPSYLTAWPSRDLVRAAHQPITRELWSRRDGFELYP